MSARICVTLLGRDYNITREDAEALNRELTAILKSEHQEVIIVHPSPVDSGFDVPSNPGNYSDQWADIFHRRAHVPLDDQ